MEKDFTENENTETGFTLVDSPEERPEKPFDKPELIEDKPDDDEYQKVCFMCHRDESRAGKMFRLPQNLYICQDCMQ